MTAIKEYSGNYLIPVGSIFSKQAQKRVIKENGKLVTPVTATVTVDEQDASEPRGKEKK